MLLFWNYCKLTRDKGGHENLDVWPHSRTAAQITSMYYSRFAMEVSGRKKKTLKDPCLLFGSVNLQHRRKINSCAMTT